MQRWSFLTECAMQGTVAKPPGVDLGTRLSKEELLELLSKLSMPPEKEHQWGFPFVGLINSNIFVTVT